MPYDNIREEELKNKVGKDLFEDFDTTQIIGNVDFCVSVKKSPLERGKPKARGVSDTPQNTNTPSVNSVATFLEEGQSISLLWAEAKKGKSDIYNSIVQLILTIGKARTFDKVLPPAYLGAFDGYQIAFIPYNQIQEIFYQNDFNWNVTPSNYDTKEFKQIHQGFYTNN